MVCASTGNTAASAAAYAARAGLRVVVVTVHGSVARGKLTQARAVGVELREIDGTFNDAHLEARRLADEEGLVNVNSINPDRIEGQSSAAREVVDQLGGPPDVLALPYGGGGNTVSYAKGFGETLPRFILGEAAQRLETFATAIRIAQPVHQRGSRRRARALRRTDRLVIRGSARAGVAITCARGGNLLRARAAPPASRRSRRPGCATCGSFASSRATA